MKYLLIAFVLLGLAPAQSAEKTVVIEVATMACGPDPHAIKQSLATIVGVTNVQVSLGDKTALVTFDDQKSTADALLAAMAGTGHAGLIKP